MKNILIVTAFISSFLPGAVAKAENARQGWGVQFRQDTFDKTLFPIALMQQDGEQFDKSLIGFACASRGELASFFQAGVISMDSLVTVQFKDGEATREVKFAAAEIPNFGKRLTADAKETAELVSIFERAAGADVAFRTSAKQGSFSSIGATKIIEILKQNCPSKG